MTCTALRGRQKVAGQALAVAVLLWGGFYVERLSIGSLQVELGLLSIPFSALWLFAAINSLNLLDGADGFASTIGVVVCGTLAVLSNHVGNHVLALVAAAVAGSLLGFLRFNFPPSSIFLGDCGSMLIGLVAGALAIRCNLKSAATFAMAAPLALMAIPILDSLAAIIRRTITGQGIAVGDRAHLHHSMMRRGFGPRRLVFAAAALSALTAAGAMFSVYAQNEMYAWASVATLVAVLVGARIFGHNELKLLASRTFAFGDSLLPRPGQDTVTRQRKVGMIGSKHCEQLWEQLVDFAFEHNLSRVRLNLSGSWMDNGRDVFWEHMLPESPAENWKITVPVFGRSRVFGKLEFGANIQGDSGEKVMLALADLLSTLGPSVDKIINDAATQGLAMQAGITKRVLFINRSYWPDCEATGQLLTELCEDLSTSFDVSVLAGQPNHITDGTRYRTSGVERHNGVDIYRVRHTRFSKGSMAGKACNLVSFFVAATWQSFFIPRHQVVVVETDPFLLSLLGGLIKKWRGSHLVIYVQDVYPDVAIAIGKVSNGWITRTLHNLMMRSYSLADSIVVLGDDMRARLVDNGLPPEKIRCITNWADTDSVYPVKENNQFRQKFDLEDKFVVMHSGNMGLTQQLDQVILLAERMRNRSDVVFALVGNGASAQSLQQQASDKKLGNIMFLPYQPREELADSLSAADLHLVSMHPDICGCLVPSKVYGILASGTPLLAVVPEESDIYSLVASENIGFVATPGDLEEMEAVITRCADGQLDLAEMGRTARAIAESRFNRSHSVDAFAELLDAYILRKKAPQPRAAGNSSVPESGLSPANN